jgi:hypothetical protein
VAPEDTQLVNHPVSAENASALPPTEHPSGCASALVSRWHAPCIVEVPRGPGTAKFGAWLRAEREARGASREFIAAGLGVSVDGLAGMEAGRVQMPGLQRRRAEAALAKAELAKPGNLVQLRRRAS